jgi:ATP-binding cassette, subfamily A (ABC1), member 1
MPFITSQLLEQLTNQVLIDLFVAVFVIFALSFIPASFLVFIIEERSANVKQLQFVSGVKPYIYWISNFLWDLVNYVVPILICICMFLLFNVEAYTTKQNFPCLVFLMLFYGWAVIPLMYPMNYLFKTPSTAFVVASSMNVLLGVVTTMTTTVIEQLNDSDLNKINDRLKTLFVILFPHYGLGQGFIQMAVLYYRAKVNSFVGGSVEYDPLLFENVGKNLLAMFCQGVAYFTLNILLQYRFFVRIKPIQNISKLRFPNAVAARNNTSRDEDEDVLAEKKRVLENRKLSKQQKMLKNGDGILDKVFRNNKIAAKKEEEEEEIANALKNVANNNKNNDKDYIKLINLTKVYRKFKKFKFKKHVAVNNLSIGIDKGECFGLIGINGAGNYKMLQ